MDRPTDKTMKVADYVACIPLTLHFLVTTVDLNISIMLCDKANKSLRE